MTLDHPSLGLIQPFHRPGPPKYGQNNGRYTAYTLCFGILRHYFGLFWRSRDFPPLNSPPEAPLSLAVVLASVGDSDGMKHILYEAYWTVQVNPKVYSVQKPSSSASPQYVALYLAWLAMPSRPSGCLPAVAQEAPLPGDCVLLFQQHGLDLVLSGEKALEAPEIRYGSPM